jgi:hypothetical protein
LASAQCVSGPAPSPRTVVEQLWMMNRISCLCIGLIGLSISAAARCTDTGKPVDDSIKSPQQVVEELWKVATQGAMLTPEGWDQTARGFADYPIPSPGSPVVHDVHSSKKSILVMSNDWGILDCTIKGDRAEVVMGYYDAGRIDPLLRYSPGQDFGPMGKTAMQFTLVFAPVRYPSYTSGGNVLRVDKIMTGPAAWQIEKTSAFRWTTVNTAIRYVLEMRAKTNNPAIKKNADETLEKLLKRH